MPRPPHRPIHVGAALALLLGSMSVLLFWLFAGGGEGTATVGSTAVGDPSTTSETAATSTTGSTLVASTVVVVTAPTTTVPASPMHAWSDRRQVGEPYGDAVEGLLTFRGNPTRTYYGKGPLPSTPEVKWKYPSTPMCSTSTDLGVTSTWCGNGWTGQPVIWERPDGTTEMIFGAYDRKLHFVDADTGRPTRSPILTGDIIKGTPTIDPDGYPLVYFGSRDNKIRAVALDRNEPVVLWEYDAAGKGRWNDDWDASPLIMNDYMFEGSENSIFYIFDLDRSYDDLGLVQVDPQVVYELETWNQELLDAIGPSYPAVSVENSTAMYEGRIYFANSGGRVIGLDITGIDDGRIEMVFDYWVGDDVDATIFVDDEGYIYVSAEYERYLTRAQEVGQLVKLDPYTDGDPVVWGMYSLTEPPYKGGLWSTPALGDGVIYAVVNKGYLIAVDQETGEELWVVDIGAGSWSSPVIVDDRLLVAANTGYLRSFSLADPRQPRLEWTFKVGESHIEATPAVWKGMIFVGSRDGYMYGIGEADN